MALLDAHLDQIELCSSTISDLPFLSPKIFTNALLHTHDITALIRDTEAHERALFTLITPSDAFDPRTVDSDTSRRSTVFNAFQNGSEPPMFAAPRRNTAVATVLGGDLAERIRRERLGVGNKYRRTTGSSSEDLDVDLLLHGAEKLCAAYPMPEAAERIIALKTRYGKVKTSLDHYESLVAEQSQQLGRVNKHSSFDADEDIDKSVQDTGQDDVLFSVQDLKREEDGIKELEKKKKLLEERVNGMEKDLGGLLR